MKMRLPAFASTTYYLYHNSLDIRYKQKSRTTATLNAELFTEISMLAMDMTRSWLQLTTHVEKCRNVLLINLARGSF